MIPTASTSPKSVRLSGENPKACITKNVSMSETRIARVGMIDAHRDCRNTTTRTTSGTASSMKAITASTDSSMGSVGF